MSGCGESLIAAIGVAAGAILTSIAAMVKADAARKRAEAELVLAKATATKRAREVVDRMGLRTPPKVMLQPVSRKSGVRGTNSDDYDYEILSREVLTDEELLDEWIAGRITETTGRQDK